MLACKAIAETEWFTGEAAYFNASYSRWGVVMEGWCAQCQTITDAARATGMG
jgi:hypothetical protein